MKCSFSSCSGEYERREVSHPLRIAGHLVIIDHVPACVCPVCGDVLFEAETVRRIERLVARRGDPDGTAPVFEYAKSA